ncbi:MAG: acyltransferase [Clostridia bacterium]|nr:acyltransferase [Clostridia bacterium]
MIKFAAPPRRKQKNRLDYIDGIRGIASVLVVLCHLACVFYPSFYRLNDSPSTFERIYLLSPLNVITNGNSAVQCFFTLSGFLIARKFYLRKESAITSPLKLYVKLLKVIFPAVTLAFLLMFSGAMFHLDAARINDTLSFLNDYNNFKPTVKSLINDAFFRTYIEYSVYVGPLWTIRTEFIGSLMISAVSYYASSKRNLSKLIYIVFGIAYLFYNPIFCGFIAGAFAFDCVYNSKDNTDKTNEVFLFPFRNKIIRFSTFIVGVYLFSTGFTLDGLYKPLGFLPDVLSGNLGVIRATGCAICLLCVEFSHTAKTALSIKPIRWIGSISAYTYAFHWPIILSAGCGIYILLNKYYSYGVLFIFILLVVFVITFSLAWGYTKFNPFIDRTINLVFDRIKLLYSNCKTRMLTNKNS